MAKLKQGVLARSLAVIAGTALAAVIGYVFGVHQQLQPPLPSRGPCGGDQQELAAPANGDPRNQAERRLPPSQSPVARAIPGQNREDQARAGDRQSSKPWRIDTWINGHASAIEAVSTAFSALIAIVGATVAALLLRLSHEQLRMLRVSVAATRRGNLHSRRAAEAASKNAEAAVAATQALKAIERAQFQATIVDRGRTDDSGTQWQIRVKVSNRGRNSGRILDLQAAVRFLEIDETLPWTEIKRIGFIDERHLAMGQEATSLPISCAFRKEWQAAALGEHPSLKLTFFGRLATRDGFDEVRIESIVLKFDYDEQRFVETYDHLG